MTVERVRLGNLVRRGTVAAQGGATRAGVIGTLLVLVVAATCVRLGFWQLDRLQQRRDLNALTATRLTAAPVEVADLPPDSAGAVWRRVRLAGGCEGEQIVLAGRSRRGSPGIHLLCRFRDLDGRLVLLDRGWVLSADARTVAPELYRRAPRDTVLEAVVVPFPRGEADSRVRSARSAAPESGAAPDAPRVMYRLNRAQARAVSGLDLPAWYLQATGPGGTIPIPADPPDLTDGPHLGYAIQWFSFAVIALGGWLAMVRRRPRRTT